MDGSRCWRRGPARPRSGSGRSVGLAWIVERVAKATAGSAIATLGGLAFLGGEAVTLLGDEDWSARVRAALGRVTDLIRAAENS